MSLRYAGHTDITYLPELVNIDFFSDFAFPHPVIYRHFDTYRQGVNTDIVLNVCSHWCKDV